jgi:hypothetical protein
MDDDLDSSFLTDEEYFSQEMEEEGLLNDLTLIDDKRK